MSTGRIQAHQFQTPGTSTSGGGGDNGDFNALMMTMELEFTRPQVGQVLVQNGKRAWSEEDADWGVDIARVYGWAKVCD